MRSLILLSSILISTSCYNIMVYNPTVGTSHCNFFNKISDVLVDAGHRVVQLQPVTNRKMRTGTTKAEVIKIHFNRTYLQYDDENVVAKTWLEEDANPLNLMKIVNVLVNISLTTCGEMLENRELFAKLESYNFDLAFIEGIDLCGLGIIRLLNIPQHISANSMFVTDKLCELVGAPTSISSVPAFSSKYGQNMTFVERFKNVVSTTIFDFIGRYKVKTLDPLFQSKYGADFPPLLHIIKNSTFFMTNTNDLVDFPRATIHKIVNIGGISVPPKSTEKLTEEWQRVLNLRSKTILISFGSIAKSCAMPEKYKTGLLKTLRRFPNVTFIWKYERADHKIGVSMEDATVTGDNIITIDWVPQTDLLSDSRVSGFITHGGIGSVNEATHRGVALVVIPVLGDQFRNAKMVERLGSAISFSKNDLADEEKLYAIVKRLLEDKDLHHNARRLSQMVGNSAFSAAETLVKYTEFAIKMGPFPQLDSYATKLNFFQYYLLDVIALCTFLTLSFVAIIVYVICRVCRISRKHVKSD